MRWLRLLRDVVRFCFEDILHQSHHLPSGACRVDHQEDHQEAPRVLQARWRSEGAQRSDEDEEDELSLREV